MSKDFQLNQYSVQVNGVQLCVRSTQQTHKPVLYCLHGGPGFDSASLVPGLLPLASIFDLRFVDLRGNGESTDPADGDYSLAAYCQDILCLISQEANGRAVGVLGHSFGGLVAIQLLAQRTHNLDFGILCNAPFDTGYQSDFSGAIRDSTDAEVAKAQEDFDGKIVTDDDYRRASIALRSIYFPELDPVRAADLMNSWIYRAKSYLYADSRILPGLDLREQARTIRAPCLIVGGDVDPVTTPDYLGRYRELLRRSTIKSVSRTGHFPFLTATERFSYQVSQWWELNRNNLQKGEVKS